MWRMNEKGASMERPVNVRWGLGCYGGDEEM